MEQHAFFSVDPQSVLQAVIGFNRAPLIMEGPHWPAVYESDSPGTFLARLYVPYHDMLLAISQCVYSTNRTKASYTTAVPLTIEANELKVFDDGAYKATYNIVTEQSSSDRMLVTIEGRI